MSKNVEIEYKGYKYFYRINRNNSSELPPILFISGAFQNMNSWKNISEYFSTKTTTILADLPGMGISEFLPKKENFDFVVESMNKILEREKIEKVYLISISYGAIIGYKFSQKYSEKVSLLALLGAMTEMPQKLDLRIRNSINVANKGNAEKFADLLLQKGILYDENDADEKIKNHDLVNRAIRLQLKRLDKQDLKKYATNTERLLNENDLDFEDKTKFKKIVFTGEFDILTTPELCRIFAKKLNNVTFTTIRNSDHIFHIQQLETTIELLYQFGIGGNLKRIENCNEFETFNK